MTEILVYTYTCIPILDESHTILTVSDSSRKVVNMNAFTNPFNLYLQSFDVIEKEIMNGQKLQGPHTLYQVYKILKENELTDR